MFDLPVMAIMMVASYIVSLAIVGALGNAVYCIGTHITTGTCAAMDGIDTLITITDATAILGLVVIPKTVKWTKLGISGYNLYKSYVKEDKNSLNEADIGVRVFAFNEE